MAGGFEALGLCPELVRAVKDDFGYLLPTNVQDEAIPLMLGGGDVMAAAESGSGKTAAFALPVLQLIHEEIRGSLRTGDTKSTTAASPTVFEWRINMDDKDAVVATSPNGLACQSRAPKWAGARAQCGVSGGVYYYEAIPEDDGLCRFGWATQAASYILGADSSGFGFGGTGMKSNKGKFEDYGKSFGKDDVIGCLLDLNKGVISFSKNDCYLGLAYKLSGGQTGPFFPAVCLKNAQASFNFGGMPFRYPPPAPYTGLVSAESRYVIDAGAPAASSKHGVRTPVAIILEPVRDLAEQVSDCITGLKRYLRSPSVEHALLVGGTDVKADMRSLQATCDVVVGTAGRILGMLKEGSLKTSSVRLLVLDEADHFLKTDNLKSIMEIYNRLPKKGIGENRLQVCFFSATLHSPEIAELSGMICDRPVWVDLKGKDSIPDTVHHAVVRINPKNHALVDSVHPTITTDGVNHGMNGEQEEMSEMIKKLKPQVLLGLIQSLRMDQALIFCRTNLDCNLLEQFLVDVGGGQRFFGKSDTGKENKYSCCVLAGMRSMKERRINLQAFKDGDVRFLICTDVAARGIDIKGIPYVVNMTLPDAPQIYIHRVGRVGRQDCLGLAISLVAADGYKEKVWFHKKCRNRGQDCSNRALVSAGGCTLWYNEQSLLKSIEKHLGQTIQELGEGYTLPAGLGGGDTCNYGQSVASTVTGLHELHHLGLPQLAVQELAALELEAQNNYLIFHEGKDWTR
ncbi:unnamed protein product [Choristocarpus tenellus]